jgi:methylamine dehydrogenase accessory protein MauD
MLEALVISNAVLWVVVIALALIIVALARQIGVLYERVAPAGALALAKGPRAGDILPEQLYQDIDGGAVRIGGMSPSGKSTLLFFLAPNCPVCSSLIPVLKSIANSERSWLEVVLASDGEPEEHQRYRQKQELAGFSYVLSRELGMGLNIGKLPYAVLIDEKGTIVASGLTNSREHLESLFEAKEHGVASIQEYLNKSAGQHGANS